MPYAEFELNGVIFTAMDCGPSFSFSRGFSMRVTFDTREELDTVLTRLSEGGNAGAVVRAFLKMKKFDIVALQKAYKS